MKNTVWKGLAVALSIGLCTSLLPASAFAGETAVTEPQAATNNEQTATATQTTASAAQTTNAAQTAVESAQATDTEESQPTDIVARYTITAPLITFEQTMTCDSLDSDGNCALKAGNYVNYIDRVDLPEWAVEFYNTLVEASDNDGENDFLINRTTDDENTYVLIIKSENTGAFNDYNDSSTALGQEFSADMAYVNALYQAFDRDHPEVFWLKDISIVVSRSQQSDGNFQFGIWVSLTSGLGENYSTASIKSDIAIRDEQVQTILAGAPTDPAYTVKYFNDWLTHNNEYNTLVADGGTYYTVKNNSVWECISALKGQSGEDGPVCEAYARAMKVLCDAAKIPCVLVSNSEHMWNYIEIGSTWYGMDVTWNDPVLATGPVGAVSGYERNSYTLVGGASVQKTATFLEEHPVTNALYVNGTEFTNGPELSSTSYDWSTHVHSYVGEITKEATTTEEGVKTYTCKGCGDSYTETIPVIVSLKVPTVTVSAAAGTSTRKIVFTGCFTDYANIDDYYEITAHGILYMTTARLGTRMLTTTTSGRTKVTFGAYKDDGSFTYTIRATSATTTYTVRSFITYKAADGSLVTVYSEPITVSYNGLK